MLVGRATVRSGSESADKVAENIRLHERISHDYNRTHGEIFNDIEQSRLRRGLELAVASIQGGASPRRVLDFGCGTGNLTNHLVEMGLRVTAADVTPRFLQMVQRQYGVETAMLDGHDLPLDWSGRFDLVATYSVLHHVPDYLRIVHEMMRVLRPGGVLFLDHEQCPSFWESPPELREFQAQVTPPRTWRRLFAPRRLMNLIRPRWYRYRWNRLWDLRYSDEGDIHVWPDDHIEWELVETAITDGAGLVIVRDDYLLYRSHYPVRVWRQYVNRCQDVRMVIAVKL